MAFITIELRSNHGMGEPLVLDTCSGYAGPHTGQALAADRSAISRMQTDPLLQLPA